MSLIPIIGDLHFGARDDHQNILQQQREYFQNEFFPWLDQYPIDHILCTGDVFDRRKYVNYNTFFQTKEFFFDELLKRNIRLTVILGNHDVMYKNTNRVNSPHLLLSERYDNITVVDKPQVISIDKSKIAMVPWINKENYSECISFLNENKDVDLLLGHFEIQGFEIQTGHFSKTGLSSETFNGYPLVISGHFHKPSYSGNIWYPGSLFEFTWNDYGDEKGFVVYDTETGETQKKTNPYQLFHKVFYNDSDEFELKKKHNTNYLKQFEGKFVKVIVQERNDRQKFESFLSDLYGHNPYDIQIVESNEQLELSEDEVNLETLSTIEVIESTIDNMQEMNVPKPDIKKLFRDLYNEALQVEAE